MAVGTNELLKRPATTLGSVVPLPRVKRIKLPQEHKVAVLGLDPLVRLLVPFPLVNKVEQRPALVEGVVL